MICCHRGEVKSRFAVLLVGILIAGCGSSGPHAAPKATAPPPSPLLGGELDGMPGKGGTWTAILALQEAAEQRRLAAIAAARQSPTVEAALRVARLTGRISARE